MVQREPNLEKKEILYEHFGSELTESILNMTINDTKKVSEIVEKMNQEIQQKSIPSKNADQAINSLGQAFNSLVKIK